MRSRMRIRVFATSILNFGAGEATQKSDYNLGDDADESLLKSVHQVFKMPII